MAVGKRPRHLADGETESASSPRHGGAWSLVFFRKFLGKVSFLDLVFEGDDGVEIGSGELEGRGDRDHGGGHCDDGVEIWSGELEGRGNRDHGGGHCDHDVEI